MSSSTLATPSFLPSPRSPSMDDIIDLSAFGGPSSSRESSPALRLPSTPPPMDPTFTDAFYQSFLNNLGPLTSSNSATMGTAPTKLSSELVDGSTLLPDSPSSPSNARLWDFDRYLSSSSSFSNSNMFLTNESSNHPLDEIPLFSSYAPNSPPLTVITSPSVSAPSPFSHSHHSTTITATNGSTTNPELGHAQFAIDPMLVATPSAGAVNYPNGMTPSSLDGSTPSSTLSASSAVSVKKERQSPVSLSRSGAGGNSRAQSVGEEEEEEESDEEEMSLSPFSAADVPKSNGGNGGTGNIGAGPGGVGKGRKSASGIVQSGGVSKRVTSAVVAPADGPVDPDDWRPTPEEYKKLSSKEKRQLRNKISARNFRVRRKEYISTLESHIADRDRIIDTIREELGQSKTENNELRQEVETLKRALLEGRSSVQGLGLPPPVPLDANGNPVTAAVTSSPATNTRRAAATSQFSKPNTRKDVSATPGSPRSGRAFWGGAASLGGVTPVHATLVPDYEFPPLSENGGTGARKGSTGALPSSAYVPPLLGMGGLGANSGSISSLLSGKRSVGVASASAFYREQENLNPLLNQIPPKPTQANGGATGPGGKSGGWPRSDALLDVNPFTIKSTDDYRMHLWAQLTREASARKQQQQQQSQLHSITGQIHPLPGAGMNNAPVTNGLLEALKPAWHVASGVTGEKDGKTPSSPKSTLAALLSGKTTSPTSSTPSSPWGLLSPPSSPRSSVSSLHLTPQQQQHQPTQQQALAATLASGSLLSRLGSSFWDAFTGTSVSNPALSTSTSTPTTTASATPGATMKGAWDVEKVKKVLDGRAVVRVVDVERLYLLDEKKAVGAGASAGSGLDGLEEKMGKMALGGSTSAVVVAGEECHKKGNACTCRPPIFTNLRG
ncbi:uncharacterized protein EI90DRAFT_3018854 [Cantharellus anzutake]|uniref:uncharacterized protein n=1 Tax=Cantharellus anzutake TaxID=1750568 RepID=UPI001903660D|nr:uncharacterized protein EI90DRAFT_3018854 [Cantharellus anzutake]KAF8325769.1 hypothetical protein EI90DRAFT_3018854 [Cantharellus anzutake]